MAALRAPLSCLTADELRVKVEDLQLALAELSLKELSNHRSEMLQREEAVRDRESAVARREEEVGRREMRVAKREEALRDEKAFPVSSPWKEEVKAPWVEETTPSMKHALALLCTPTPSRSTLSKPVQLQMTLKSVDDAVAVEPTVPAVPPVPLFGETSVEPATQVSSSPTQATPFSSPSPFPSPSVEAGSQKEEASQPEEGSQKEWEYAQATTQYLDRMRRLTGTPGKGNSSMLKAMFEQRVLDVAEQKKESQPKRQAFRRRSSGSVGAVTSTQRECTQQKPEVHAQRSLTSSSSASMLVSASSSLGKDRPLHSARTSQSSFEEELAALKGPAPKVTLQDLLRQDEVKEEI